MTYLDTKAEERMFQRQKEILHRIGVKEKVQVFDIGGNIGQSIAGYRNLFPTSKIISFEPLPDCFETLMSKYGESEDICLENLAISDKTGKSFF